MKREDMARSLTEMEKKTLTAVSNKKNNIQEITEVTGLNIDSVRRAIGWLSEKGFITGRQTEIKKHLRLTGKGKEYVEQGLPENRMIKTLKDKEMQTFDELTHSANLNPQEFNVALGINKKKNFITILEDNGQKKIKLSEVKNGPQDEEQKTLMEINEDKKPDNEKAILSLIGRGLIEEISEITMEFTLTNLGLEIVETADTLSERTYDVEAKVPNIYIGKKQPYIQFLNIIRRKLTELGFKEMESPLIVQEFYNFDVLFQPQNHPARTWTDTYQLKNPTKGELRDKNNVRAIKKAHESGGVAASTGWQYSWLEEIASKVMPTAHGTAHSARQLTKGIEIPGKYFTIARCFRPDVLDATHLIEFNQTDGFIAGEELNFTHLLGMLEQFAKEIAGAKEVKFLPDYYPFTEPSVQLSAKHPQLGWVELGGAGMFRPEILENLGIKGQAIAWGIGIDRLAMFKLGIKDIRYLFSDDLNWLRKTPLVME